MLDNASADGSRKVINRYAANIPSLITTIFNEINSGNVFTQWQRGYEAARGDLVWICESDDYCEPDFLEKLVPSFVDESVMLAFGRVQYADRKGLTLPGLDHYRESAEAGIWRKRVVRPAFEWFSNAFGVKNVIPNVGGTLWRRCPIEPTIWEKAKTFKVMGDWYLYLAVPRGGQIAFEPGAVSYFRQHGGNNSVDAQQQEFYHDEYKCLMTCIRETWPIPDATVRRFVEGCREVYSAANPNQNCFDELADWNSLYSVRRNTIHVFMGILGFSYGDGELLPIYLSNALANSGVNISVLSHFDDVEDKSVRQMLGPGISRLQDPKTPRHCFGAVLRARRRRSLPYSFCLNRERASRPLQNGETLPRHSARLL